METNYDKLLELTSASRIRFEQKIFVRKRKIVPGMQIAYLEKIFTLISVGWEPGSTFIHAMQTDIHIHLSQSSEPQF